MKDFLVIERANFVHFSPLSEHLLSEQILHILLLIA